MCRHLCYLGREPVLLRELLFDPPHSLVRQSFAPQDMRGGGSVNVDGFGAGWYAARDQPALRYRRAGPTWHESAFTEIAARTEAVGVLAADRNATVGMPITETAAAPFTDGRWLFSLNGRINGWPDTAVELAATLPLPDLLRMDAPTDSALLWAALRHRLGLGTDPGAALAELVVSVEAAAPGSRLNLLLTDGSKAYATTLTHSLSVLAADESVLIASEPLDDRAGWRPIADRMLLGASLDGVSCRPL